MDEKTMRMAEILEYCKNGRYKIATQLIRSYMALYPDTEIAKRMYEELRGCVNHIEKYEDPVLGYAYLKHQFNESLKAGNAKKASEVLRKIEENWLDFIAGWGTLPKESLKWQQNTVLDPFPLCKMKVLLAEMNSMQKQYIPLKLLCA